MQGSFQFKNNTLALFIVLISLVVFAESAIPYIYAERKAAPGTVFCGQINYMPDQAMYFSFIRQARDGKFIFNNHLTYIPNKPAFINLEFWVVGFIQRITGLSEYGTYQVWRYLGILLLTIGITLLARIVLPTTRQVLACTAILLFTGGFGFIFALLNSLHLLSFDAVHNGIIDMRFGFLPFPQLTTNPHFSFPHGLILIAYAFFLLGERSGKTSSYLLSGLFFFIIGLVRPYDIMAPFLILPVYVLITDSTWRQNIASLAKKMLPLIVIIPVLLYNIWLFKFNDAFKEWSTQGLNAGGLPSALWHYLGYGIVSILAIVRLLQYRTNPFSKNDKFLIVWFLATFIIIQAGKYFPVIGFSPQIGVYLAVPLALLGCSVKFGPRPYKLSYYAIIVATGICVIASNISIVLYYVKNFSESFKAPLYYADKDELTALRWMSANTKEGDVVLAIASTSLQIAKYTSASVVAAHYSVTPHYYEANDIINRLFADSAIGPRQSPVLQKLHVTYIYTGPTEKVRNPIKVEVGTYITQVYKNPAVTIYRVNAL